jgi:hypothetical protein
MTTRMKRGVAKETAILGQETVPADQVIEAGNNAAEGDEDVMKGFVTELGTALWERGVTADEVKSNLRTSREICMHRMRSLFRA